MFKLFLKNPYELARHLCSIKAQGKQDIRKERPSQRQYDWTYQTSYKGTVKNGTIESSPDARIDIELKGLNIFYQ